MENAGFLTTNKVRAGLANLNTEIFMNATLFDGGKVHQLNEAAARCGVGKSRKHGEPTNFSPPVRALKSSANLNGWIARKPFVNQGGGPVLA
jgi:hypothetical protein